MIPSVTVSDTQLVVRRTLAHPPAVVFDAWTTPAKLRQWWKADGAWTTPIAEVDLRVGGRYRLGMRNPGADTPYVVGGRFLEVDPPNRLVYTWAWEPPSSDPTETRVTVEFLEVPAGTDLVLTHTLFLREEDAEKHGEGWSGCLSSLERLIDGGAV